MSINADTLIRQLRCHGEKHFATLWLRTAHCAGSLNASRPLKYKGGGGFLCGYAALDSLIYTIPDCFVAMLILAVARGVRAMRSAERNDEHVRS